MLAAAARFGEADDDGFLLMAGLDRSGLSTVFSSASVAVIFCNSFAACCDLAKLLTHLATILA
jgi:hypothetical protein